MENTVLIITIALQRDVENGDVSAVAVEMTAQNAEWLLKEQSSCPLVSEGGALSDLLNAYALLVGYQCAWFLKAEAEEE